MTKREKILLGVLGGVVVLSVGSLAYSKYFNKQNTQSNTTTATTATTSTTNISVNEQKTTSAKITSLVDQGVTWLSEPNKIEDLKLFKQSDNFDCNIASPNYYKIASLENGGELIMARLTCGMGAEYTFRFKNVGGKYSLLTKYTNYIPTGQDFGNFLVDYGTKTSADSSSIYGQISSPDVIQDEDNITYKKGMYAPFMGGLSVLFSSLSNPEEVAESIYGKIYRVYADSSESANARIRYLYLKHADGTADTYGLPIKFMSDDSVPNVTVNSVQNKQKYFPSIVVGKCGGLGSVSIIAKTENMSTRIKEIGKTNDNEKIYGLINKDDALLQVAYESYKTGRASGILTLEEFSAKEPVFLWKDALGQYVTFFSQEYAPLAECGKPVVYLYPTKPTDVSVKVDVDMTVSDPTYDKGWNVLASPSGKLTLNGKDYPYLYWEGKGKIYSQSDKGFVVETSKVKEKIAEDLSSLGLNAKEIADFLEFWLPKMPKTSYVRLTWMGTTEMNQLAPMTIDPKPDTVIRVFLDFEGLNEKIDIQPQVLKAKERKGFTVIEWGGLLVNTIK